MAQVFLQNNKSKGMIINMGKHAYLIVCHNNWKQVEFLIEMLIDPRNDFFVLVDSKSKDFDRAEFTHNYPNAQVYFAKPVSIYWGDYSLVEACISLLHSAMEHGKYDYYHLISGVDMPLKTQDEIHRFFDEHKGTEFVDYYHGDGYGMAMERTRFYYFFQKQVGRKGISALKIIRDVLVRLQKLSRVNRVKDIEHFLGKGSNWFSITDDFARYILDNEKLIRRYFRYTYASDEVFIQTMLNMSPFKENWYGYKNKQLYYSNLRLTDWKRGKPYTFKKEEYFDLCESPYLFARKFGSDIVSEDVRNYLKGK